MIAVPLITVGSPGHALAVDVHLRPRLLELGARTPTAALVVGEGALAEPTMAIDRWLQALGPVLRSLLPAGHVLPSPQR